MLTDIAVRNAKPADKPYKLSDERGLYLHVMPNAGRYWRMNYRHAGKQKTLAIGVYPDVSLKDARERRDDARRLMSNGVDPGEVKAAQKASGKEAAGNSFEVLAREWFATARGGWVASHADRIMRRLERDVFPWLGSKPITEVKAPDVLRTLRRIEDRGAVETAHRAMGNIGQVF
ncbi:MAG: tyrosine-type recombinase/integrase, partial [Thiobacillus sp.]